MYAKNFLENVKKRCGLLFCAVFYSGFAWAVYDLSVPGIVDILQSRSIIYFIWPCFMGLLSLPAFCCFVLAVLFKLFSRDLQPSRILAKGITLGFHYIGTIFIIGNLISFIVILYPLGTNYVLCERTGPFSGVYYTATEEICEQVIYLRKNKPPEAIQELKDELDSVEPR